MSGMKVPQSEAALFIGSEKSAVGSLAPLQFSTVKKKKKKKQATEIPLCKAGSIFVPWTEQRGSMERWVFSSIR